MLAEEDSSVVAVEKRTDGDVTAVGRTPKRDEGTKAEVPARAVKRAAVVNFMVE